jgi:molybdate transport system substrate-binding protein
VRVIFNFAGSQQLAAQIGQGAPANLFASANQTQMQVAIAAGRVDAQQVRIFASNQLMVVVSPTSQVAINTLADLASPAAKSILADPSVPAGQYALQFLQQAAADPAHGPAFEQAVPGRVVLYEENVCNVLSKVGPGEADAGIVYTSDAITQSQLRQIGIPAALNVQARYPIATLSDSKQRDVAERFVAFVLSESGQQILANTGFGAP